MKKKKGFTLIELLVVIAIIALLMSILMPALNRVKGQARTVACQGRLKQWSVIFAMYTNDNNGYFHNRPFGSSYEKMWPQFYKSYYSDPRMRCCPSAQNPEKHDGPFGTWGWKKYEDPEWGWGGTWVPEEGYYGSYGFSRWALNNKDPANWGRTGEKHSDEVPIFTDCAYVAMNPTSTDSPPTIEGMRGNQMQYVCLDRHDGHINGLFLDFSVRKIGLKELWTLRWSKTFDTAGPWTLAGGAQPSDWPAWMQSFEDY
jgi:prepilin-type N-terminal cleavage/methylation domain-containing protein/prepilin-type processing-associated H-X9-DG protein